ncbi:MAG: 4Fe-4S dicluster domain-containing protein [Actinomyces sp.]|nr:MAG: 4Fe-4S dicluster domain-containing protein [Actinomyces sp.]
MIHIACAAERSDPPDAGTDERRRRFLAGVLGTAAATVAADTALAAPAAAEADSTGEFEASVAPAPAAFAAGNHLERMRADLHRALQKPVDQRRWGMVIDLQKCIGCKACTVSCIAENASPPGVEYRPVLVEEIGTFPNVRTRFVPRPCMQCDDPPCVPPCPVGATFKRPDGVVEVDYDQCIGCRYCITSCPYGARSFDFGEYYTEGTPAVMPYETRANYEYGREWRRDPDRPGRSPIGNARKCHFCLHRVEAGLLPACTTTCIGGATYFGDLNDPESLVSELAATERAMRLKEELGTNPKVYYLA